MPSHYAIVPAAGSGSRFGEAVPKQYLPLLGKPLIWHSLKTLCNHPEIDRVWVVLSPHDPHWRRSDWQDMWLDLGHKLEVTYCGGESRAQSVINGLLAGQTAILPDDWVLVHDAARPCLSAELLGRLFEVLADDPVGGLLAVPLADTLKRANGLENGQARVAATLSREKLWRAQTPQMFRYGLLLSALISHPELTDEAGAVEAAGHSPRLVPGMDYNFKVTYPADMAMAQWILSGRSKE